MCIFPGTQGRRDDYRGHRGIFDVLRTNVIVFLGLAIDTLRDGEERAQIVEGLGGVTYGKADEFGCI